MIGWVLGGGVLVRVRCSRPPSVCRVPFVPRVSRASLAPRGVVFVCLFREVIV